MQTLEQWLSVATRRLCAAAVERVRGEISDHYQSALESALAEGLDAVEAGRRAVAALGHAKTANRQYRRVLLTKGEDRLLRGMTLEDMYLEGPHKRRMFCNYIALMLVAAAPMVVLSLWDARLWYITVALILEWLIFPTVYLRSIRAGRRIRGMRWSFLAAGATLSILSGRTIVVMCMLHLAYVEYKRFVLRSKVPVDQWPKRLYN